MPTWNLVAACSLLFALLLPSELSAEDPHRVPVIAFHGLHGGVFSALREHERELGLRLVYIEDAAVKPGMSLAGFNLVLIQHLRRELRDSYKSVFQLAKAKNPRLRILSISGDAKDKLPLLAQAGVIESDPHLKSYYGNSKLNLKRLLIYLKVKYLGSEGRIEAPEEPRRSGIFHPDAGHLFESSAEFLAWASATGRDSKAPRVGVLVHFTHLLLQQPAVVTAIIRALEKRKVLAFGLVDLNSSYQARLRELKPSLVIHTCHSRERADYREKLGIPHLHSIFFRKQSIAQWRKSKTGLTSSELAFHVVSQELQGAIEPQIGAGTTLGGGSAEAFTPIAERIDHLADRARAWLDLAGLNNSKKKVALIYWNREMGKAELMRGSATGMFLNGPRSVLQVLQRLDKEGYSCSNRPSNEEELIARMSDHGRQVGVWAPGVLETLARSGRAILIPAERYAAWLKEKVPEPQRKALIKQWGPPPGRFMVWRDQNKKSFIVIPRVDLGNIILLPQPLRGEANDSSLVHDRRVPPPHNYLATYFWLSEDFKANALIHFGTHGTEFMLPGKGTGLGPGDWSDLILGAMPNLNPWVVNNLGESSPAKRRSYAVLINHLSAPVVRAGLADELLDLHRDIDKWEALPQGALKEQFRLAITKAIRAEKLDEELGLLKTKALASADEIRRLVSYLHEIENESIPTSLHILGLPPKPEQLVPYLVFCLGRPFLDALEGAFPLPPEERRFEGDGESYLAARGAEVIRKLTARGITDATAAVSAVGGELQEGQLSKELARELARAVRLARGFAQTGQEIEGIVQGLAGKYVAPGPANSPDRNPGVLPTGRNMFVMNPAEVPSRPSWKLGKALVDKLLASRSPTPKKIGFTLSSFATFQDYGVMEAQILSLIGVRPIWDERERVIDVKLIPAQELGRPRVDVFIALGSYYRDMLPTRLRLLDKALRLVAGLQEPGNTLWANSGRMEARLRRSGLPAPEASRLARARIFGNPPGQMGNPAYYYLVERSGQWDKREELMELYLAQARHVYTKGAWGKLAPEAYNSAIQDTELVLRSWSDRVRSPLSNKYAWFKGGSLCLAIEHLTGKRPDFLLTDLRDSSRARLVVAEEVLRRDFRSRLFNPKWIRGMMEEGYAGADQIAKHVSNALGWEIMRQGSVPPETWERIVDVFLRDSKKLALREWFDQKNPFAFQELTEILLETIRKGYWAADAATTREIAEAYLRSVVEYGEGGGLFAGGNVKLEDFVKASLKAPGQMSSSELAKLLKSFEQRLKESKSPNKKKPPAPARPRETRQEKPAALDEPSKVAGQVLKPSARPSSDFSFHSWKQTLIALLAVLLILAGYGLRWGNNHVGGER